MSDPVVSPVQGEAVETAPSQSNECANCGHWYAEHRQNTELHECHYNWREPCKCDRFIATPAQLSITQQILAENAALRARLRDAWRVQDQWHNAVTDSTVSALASPTDMLADLNEALRPVAGSPVHEGEDEQRQLEVARQAVLDAMPLSWAEQDPGFAGTAAHNIARAVMTALSETVRDA